jgi:hypothetical protein
MQQQERQSACQRHQQPTAASSAIAAVCRRDGQSHRQTAAEQAEGHERGDADRRPQREGRGQAELAWRRNP